MQLYYSNSQTAGGEQKNPQLSLGGYISASIIPNNLLNNLISDVSKLLIEDLISETFLIVLTNTLDNDVDNVKIWYDYPVDDEDENVSQVTLKLAPVSPSVDDCGDYVFERLISPQASPVYGTFVEANGNGNAIDIGTIESGKSVGIWIEKTINEDNAQPLTCDQLYQNFTDEVEVDIKQTINFYIHYNEDNSVSLSISM